MKTIVTALALILPAVAYCWDNSYDTSVAFGGYQPNAYGLGVNSDQYGRPFKWQTPDAGTDSFLEVTPNAYGLGAHADQYGRPVHAVPFPER